MTEEEWFAENNPRRLLQVVATGLSKRQRRLMGVACCRLVIPLLTNPRWQAIIAAAEVQADRSDVKIDSAKMRRRGLGRFWGSRVTTRTQRAAGYAVSCLVFQSLEQVLGHIADAREKPSED